MAHCPFLQLLFGLIFYYTTLLPLAVREKFQALCSGIRNRVLPTQIHTPSPEDVLMVRAYLTKLVPPELTHLIIDYAKYWPKASFHWRAHFGERATVVVSTMPEPGSSTTFICLATPKLRDWIGRRAGVKPRAVRFKIVSNDQGWCSDPNPPAGIYAGSWTWFEAAIFRDSEKNGDNITGDREASIRHPELPEGAKIIPTVKPPYGHSNVWYLQRNARASSVEKRHEITWTNELNIGDVENPDYVSDDTGRGQGVGFVESLELDDMIAVIARAKYPGWENHIHNVAVELEYAV